MIILPARATEAFKEAQHKWGLARVERGQREVEGDPGAGPVRTVVRRGGEEGEETLTARASPSISVDPYLALVRDQTLC